MGQAVTTDVAADAVDSSEVRQGAVGRRPELKRLRRLSGGDPDWSPKQKPSPQCAASKGLMKGRGSSAFGEGPSRNSCQAALAMDSQPVSARVQLPRGIC